MIRLALVATLTLACSRSSPAPPSLDYQVVTETTVLRGGEALPKSSPIMANSEVKLRGVRGETVAFVVAFRGEARSRALELEAAAGVSVGRFVIDAVPVIEPSSALFGPSRGPGSYFDKLSPYEPSSPATHLYLELAIAADAAPGARAMQLTVDDLTIAVTLEIMPYSIALGRAPLVWAWYDARFVGDIAKQLELQSLFLEHGVLLATDPHPDDLEANRPLIAASALYFPVRVRARTADELAANTRRAVEFFEPLGATPFTIPIDEPPDDAARRRVVDNGRVIRAAGGGPRKLLHAVTDYRRPIYKDAVDIFISPANVRHDSPAPARRWTYNGRPPRAGNMTVDSRSSLRSWGWIGFRYDVELWYAWHALYYKDRYNGATEDTDLGTSMITFDQRRKNGRGDYGNGDGLLLYPGKKPSMRLKALRRGLADRLLLAKLRACGGGDTADSIARATVPRALGDAGGVALWPGDEHGWETARGAVLDGLVQHCPPE